MLFEAKQKGSHEGEAVSNYRAVKIPLTDTIHPSFLPWRVTRMAFKGREWDIAEELTKLSELKEVDDWWRQMMILSTLPLPPFPIQSWRGAFVWYISFLPYVSPLHMDLCFDIFDQVGDFEGYLIESATLRIYWISWDLITGRVS